MVNLWPCKLCTWSIVLGKIKGTRPGSTMRSTNTKTCNSSLTEKNTRANNKVNELYGDRYPTSPFFFFVFCTPEYNTPLLQKKIATSPKFVFVDLTEYPTSQKKMLLFWYPTSPIFLLQIWIYCEKNTLFYFCRLDKQLLSVSQLLHLLLFFCRS